MNHYLKNSASSASTSAPPSTISYYERQHHRQSLYLQSCQFPSTCLSLVWPPHRPRLRSHRHASSRKRARQQDGDRATPFSSSSNPCQLDRATPFASSSKPCQLPSYFFHCLHHTWTLHFDIQLHQKPLHSCNILLYICSSMPPKYERPPWQKTQLIKMGDIWDVLGVTSQQGAKATAQVSSISFHF